MKGTDDDPRFEAVDTDDFTVSADERLALSTHRPWTAITVMVDGGGQAGIIGATVNVRSRIAGQLSDVIFTGVVATSGQELVIRGVGGKATERYEVSIQGTGALARPIRVAILGYGVQPS